MPKYQARTIKLTKAKATREVTIDRGNVSVWTIDAQGWKSGHGSPIFNEAAEREACEQHVQRLVQQGYRIVADTGLVPASAAKKRVAGAKVSRATATWLERADEVLAMWSADEYDNHKDAIFDARDLLRRPPAKQTVRLRATIRLVKAMLAKAERELEALADEDAGVAEYAKGLLPPRKAAKPKAPAQRKVATAKPKPAQRTKAQAKPAKSKR